MSVLLIGTLALAMGGFGYLWLVANGCTVVPEALMLLSVTCTIG